MPWDDEYRSRKRIWGEGPGELASIAVSLLKETGFGDGRTLDILDIGCGYGRDALYFCDSLRCRVLGVDLSAAAIAIANSALKSGQRDCVEFRRLDFSELGKGRYDVVFVSNVYHLLVKSEREKLRETIAEAVPPEGLLFLNTLSVNDPQEYGKGSAIQDEPNSFQGRVYFHFCTEEEIRADFSFLDLRALYEHEYYESRSDGESHHHISWVLIGQLGSGRTKI